MSAHLQARAEIVKLARLLGAEPASLGYLQDVPPEHLRRLRERATDALFDRDQHVIERVAAGARLLPVAVVAAIGERVFGPLLCARVAGALDPGRAVDVAARLSPSFLGDVAVQIDPRRAKDVIAGIPPAQVAGVAAELVRRQEYVTMGRFVAFLGDDAIRAALQVIPDEGLLHTAFVLEAKERLDHVVGLLETGRLSGVIGAAAAAQLWPEALDLINNVAAARRGELADLAARQDDAVLDALIRSAHEQGLWDDVLPLIRSMSDDSRRRFAGLDAIQEEAVLDGIVGAAARQELWPVLLALVPLLPRPAQRRIARSAGRLGRPVIERVVAAAGDHGLWPVLVEIAADMEEDAQRSVAEVVATADEAVLESFLTAVVQENLYPQVLAIVQRLAEAQLQRVTDRLAGVRSEGLLPSLVRAAQDTGLWDAGLRMLAGLGPRLEQRLRERAAELSPEERRRILDHARELGLLDRLGPLRDELERGD